MSSESDEKLVSKMVRGHRYDHAQHLVLNPRGLSDRFYRNKARKGSSDSEPVSDSDPLNSKEGLEPVQDIKKVPALVANDPVESDYNGENGDESKEANEDSDEETSDEVRIHLQPTLNIYSEVDDYSSQNLMTRTATPTTELPQFPSAP
jgi:hypothetical protein